MTWSDDYSAVMMKSAPAPLALLTRGEGCYVWGEDGTRYLDFLAGIAVNSLGHAHPVVVAAISEQAARIAHISNLFASPQQIALATRLVRLAGAENGRVFFGNSGAEAIEAAIKLARRHKKHGTIIALENSFHGRTTGSVSLTGKPALREDFGPLLPNVLHIPSTIEALEQALEANDVAALVVEPIKGEAGVVELPEGYLQAARALTEKHGALLIIDEIQTGAGRTGSWFAFQQHGIQPDAIAVAKGIGGGVPIGALVTFGAASELFTKGQHGSTFGGNPLATGTADAVLAHIEDAGLVENAAVRGEQLRAAITALPGVAEVRGRGLLLGVGLAARVANEVAAACLAAGLIVNAANDATIRIAPPLIVGDAEIAEFLSIFTTALSLTAPEAHA